MHLLVPFEMEVIVVGGAELGWEIILLPGLRQVGVQPCAKFTAKRLGFFAVVEIHRVPPGRSARSRTQRLCRHRGALWRADAFLKCSTPSRIQRGIIAERLPGAVQSY